MIDIDKLIRMTALSIFFILAVFQALAGAQPTAALDENTFTFGPVPEGRIVTHTFFIENRGNSPLLIKNAKATCSCTAVDFDTDVPAGERGRIDVRFDSHGYGGRQANVHIRVETSDPSNSVFDLTVTGQVDRLLTISPPIVKLEGPAGIPMEQTVIIRPEPKYPFKIIDARAEKGRHLSFELNRIQQAGRDGYQVKVRFQADQKRRYFDKIILGTSSPHKPQITIAVFAKITG